jgi:hypothetical protein
LDGTVSIESEFVQAHDFLLRRVQMKLSMGIGAKWRDFRARRYFPAWRRPEGLVGTTSGPVSSRQAPPRCPGIRTHPDSLSPKILISSLEVMAQI